MSKKLQVTGLEITHTHCDLCSDKELRNTKYSFFKMISMPDLETAPISNLGIVKINSLDISWNLKLQY